jgi:hypothetical protein
MLHLRTFTSKNRYKFAIVYNGANLQYITWHKTGA